MANLQALAKAKALHENATSFALELQEEFTDALLYQSQLIAVFENADEVQKIHVERAKEIILRPPPVASKGREILALISSVLLGAFLQGFITEYSNNRPQYMLVYAVAGFIGLVVVFFAYKK
jgi:hypothetical protein